MWVYVLCLVQGMGTKRSFFGGGHWRGNILGESRDVKVGKREKRKTREERERGGVRAALPLCIPSPILKVEGGGRGGVGFL